MSVASPMSRVAAVLLVLWLQVASLPFTTLAPRAASAQAAGTKPPVQQGLEYYEQSRFDDAIGLLRDLVDRGQLQGEDLLRARELLARSYVKKGYPVQAKDMFKSILRQNPGYRPDPIRIPPDETSVFEQALREYSQEQGAPPATPTPAGAGAAGAAGAAGTQAAKPSMTPAGEVVPVKENKKSLASQWWVWALGAVVVGGVVAAAAGGGGGDDGGGGGGGGPLPGYPDPPTP